MEGKLNKVKHNFGKIKDIRVAVANIFNTLEVKITKLKTTTNDLLGHDSCRCTISQVKVLQVEKKLSCCIDPSTKGTTWCK